MNDLAKAIQLDEHLLLAEGLVTAFLQFPKETQLEIFPPPPKFVDKSVEQGGNGGAEGATTSTNEAEGLK